MKDPLMQAICQFWISMENHVLFTTTTEEVFRKEEKQEAITAVASKGYLGNLTNFLTFKYFPLEDKYFM